MAQFNFEKNLPHQQRAVESTISIFEGIPIKRQEGTRKEYVNPLLDKEASFNREYVQNIGALQAQNNLQRSIKGKSNIIDIAMETGTGKTYTYTKTIFELNKRYGLFKFIIVVPTLPIKAGTINFIKSASARTHFKEQYNKTIKLHIVESKNRKKNKKHIMPPAVSSFVNAGHYEKNKIQVLIINSGMLNSSTMEEKSDRTLLDHHNTPFDALAATRAFIIIDEPHKFGKEKKTWKNLQKIEPQFILRYGATFKEKDNLIYSLTAVDAFNQNLVKGVTGHITAFETGKNTTVKLISSDGTEASFHLEEHKNNKAITKTYKLAKKESLEKIHPAMNDLVIDHLNQSTVVLSNGLALKKGDKISPYSYAETLQETMIAKAVKHHFEQEKKYLKREVKIKPLTLFFIDNIQAYRNEDGYIKTTIEKYIKAEAQQLLKTEEDPFYKNYLAQTLADVAKTHAGYFAVDKKGKDEVIEKEVNEILHDKQAILSLDNPRRFIFSKWTLREGWDNPNIFQICKLRSSGSEISKLQEVGRGLRLPVNEYGHRVKDEQFYLNYFVDFTENDFVDKLVKEINENAGTISREDKYIKLEDHIIKRITKEYGLTADALLEKLDAKKVIKRNNDFKENGWEYIKAHYPLIFTRIGSNKIRKETKQKKKVRVRVEKYPALKELWELLNEKVVLEYKIENEEKFKDIFIDFL
ncbi:MAG: type III restriction-modification system endonuclease, partial [Cytophagales bacterium]